MMMESAAADYLNQGRFINEQITAAMKLLAESEEIVCNVTANYDPNRVQSSPSHRALENRICSAADRTTELEEQINQLLALREQLIRTIEQVKEPLYRLILEEYFLLNYPFVRIAENVNYSEKSVRRFVSQALEQVTVPEDAIIL